MAKWLNRRVLVASVLALPGVVACAAATSGGTFENKDDGGPVAATGAGDGAASGPVLGGGTFGDAAASDAGASTGPAALTAVIRDFKLWNAADPSTVPDFENVPKSDQTGDASTSYTGPWDDREIVQSTLGADGKPAYKSATTTLTTHGKASFDKWYNDVPGTNVRIEYPLQLTANADGSFAFDSQVTGTPLSKTDPTKMFFPIDDGTPFATPFGNQGDGHNYSFTVELHTVFAYEGGEYFQFRGDDDVFVFIDKKLVINLGGIHSAEPESVRVDALGLTKGSEYTLDFFSAERHKTASNILFTTTLKLRPAPPLK